MRERRLAVIALLAFGLLGLLGGAAPAPGPIHNETARVATIAEVASPPPVVRTELAIVRARLERYAHRTGLTRRERAELAECIVTEAQRHQLEPTLVLAVIHIESLYDSYIVSDKDAMGLMQILPSTGAWLAPKVGVEWRGPQSLFDPIVNVRIGVAYLRQLTDRYDGDIATALAAYHWGPGRIDGKLRRGTPLPTIYAQSVLKASDATRS